ncbi:MAG TPA: hypothetical protein VHB99_12120 [Pirellulales bacterium]|nr:hypothetical protein [Pirellulales bacterium]
MERLEQSNTPRGPWFPLALLLVCYALFDFHSPALIDALWGANEYPPLPGILLMLATFGCLAAQYGALVAWSVLGTRPAIGRWAVSFVAAECLLGLHTWAWALFSDRKAGFGAALEALAIGFLAAQMPVWVLRVGQGYRLVTAGERLPPARRFAVRDLLIATAAIAASLALLQLGAGDAPRAETARAVAVSCAVGFAWSVLAVLPCLHSAFLSKKPGIGSCWIATYAIVAALAATGAARALGKGDTMDILMFFGVSFGAAAFVLHGSFLVLRHCGYSLRRVEIDPSGTSA